MQQLPKQLLATRPSGSQQPRWLPSPARDTRLVAPTSFFNSPNFPQTSPTARPATAAPLQRTCPVPCAPGPSARARPCALGPSACTSCPCAPWSSAPRTPQWPCRDLQWWHVSHFRFKQKSEIRNPISCYYTPRYFGYKLNTQRTVGEIRDIFARNPTFTHWEILLYIALEECCGALPWKHARRGWKRAVDAILEDARQVPTRTPSYKGSFLKSCTSYKSKRVEMKARKNGISGFYFCKESLLSQIKKLFHSFTCFGLRVVDICRSHLYMNQLYYD